ncbi:uncharacterized protein J8A68_003706 [[Candida] subhashii]|uniref:Pre-mRNA-processing factor 17 n=1 Tax=[Candida] subhashii TaxID=561895 RepID=A0A8J5QLR3_9ASCO|nr:uncharacterized protein J8A68_003706 [[Candida] subhashii]KAG7662783.1 hypothetical protein J8A68_003706 [[Candida] subhashii]
MSIVRGYTSSSDDGGDDNTSEQSSIAQIVTSLSGQVAMPIQEDGDPPVKKQKTFAGEFQKLYYDQSTFSNSLREERTAVSQEARTKAKQLKQQRKKKRKAESASPWDNYSSSDQEFVNNQESESEQEEAAGHRIYEQAQSDYKLSIPKETTKFVGSQEEDYQGRTYMHIPRDLDIDLTKDPGTQECFVPKKVIHTFEGHPKGTNKLEYFPRSGHLLLSCGNDGQIKLWSLYRKRELLRIYSGHSSAVKDVKFNSKGDEFLSAGYDRFIHLWNTETGQIKKTIQLNSIPNVVKFNPNNENEFIVGLSNHKIEHYDLSSITYQTPIQVYDHHQGAINSLTILGNDKFMSTADDKTVRVWEWQINIPIKTISDPSLHSMPSAAVFPGGGKYIALQSMDNSIRVIHGSGKYKFNKSKLFIGHHCAGYGIEIAISPDGKIIMSGDSKGNAYFWDWKTTKIVKRLHVSEKPIRCIVFHPHESSKVAVAGSTGEIYYLD